MIESDKRSCDDGGGLEMLRKSIYFFVICIFGFYASFAWRADRGGIYSGEMDTGSIDLGCQ
jgi:hypothetical protein